MDFPKETSPASESSSILQGSFYASDSLPKYRQRFKASKNMSNLVLIHDASLRKESDLDPVEVYELVQNAPPHLSIYFAEILSIKRDDNIHTLILPRYGPSIYEVLEDNTFRGFSKVQCRKISFEILSAVQYLHDQGIIHTDLNSEVIRFRTDKFNLITDAHSTYFYVEDTRIVICDLTKCRKAQTYNDKIQIDIYRAPEVIMGLKWNKFVDCWSVGCVVCEVFCGSPFFASQRNTSDPDLFQLTHIMTYCGIVPYSMTERADPKFNLYPKKTIFTNNQVFCVGNPEYENQSFNDIYKVIRGLMCYEWSIRMSCKQALKLPFYTKYSIHNNGSTKQDDAAELSQLPIRPKRKKPRCLNEFLSVFYR
ncbi:unnamed protein product [Auanema sp. JU1783]|nr:unnamed protein product [Auanema sp. JU1783]